MSVAESLRDCLHHIKNKIQYHNAKIHLGHHLKITPSLSAVSVNHLPATLRGYFNSDYHAIDILRSADNIQHDFANLSSINCSCSCHSSPLPQTPFFHRAECLRNCGKNNKEYERYLTHKIHTVGV